MSFLNKVKTKVSGLSFKKLSKKENLIILVVFLLTAAIFLANAFHESYPDEFDNIMGGWLNLKGLLIYKDWFTHHGPFAYWLASFLEIFSGQSFVRFRVVYSVFLLFLTFGGFYYLKKSLNFERTKFYLGFILLLGLAATYFWGHMLLADSLAALLLIPVFGLLALKIYYKILLNTKDIIFISILSFFAFITAMTFSYLIAGIYLLTLIYFFFYPHGIKSFNIKKLYSILIIIIPYFIFLIYLLITGSFSDFIYQAIKFNQAFYIYNYPKPEGSTFVNPMRYAIVIAQDFQSNFFSLLTQVREFNFGSPFNITFAVVNTGFIIFLLLKRKFLLAGFIIYWMIYSNVRTNPLESRETDYQSAVYFVMSLFNICFAIYAIYEALKESMDYPKKLIISFIFILILIYSFFNIVFLTKQFSAKVYDKYMGTAPLIYDRPEIAPVLNSITSENDYVWVGPFDFEEIFYLERRSPTNYVILLPEFAKSPKIQEEMMNDLNQNKPKVIYYDKQYFIRGHSPEQYATFFQKFIDENYITVEQYNEAEGSNYSSTLPKDLHLDFQTKLFINKNSKNEVIQKMREFGYIKE